MCVRNNKEKYHVTVRVYVCVCLPFQHSAIFHVFIFNNAHFLETFKALEIGQN